MTAPGHERRRIETRLAREQGTLGLGRDAAVCMAYPSPYTVGMSSLGFQTLYRILNRDGPGAHRAFLPDEWHKMALDWPRPTRAVLSYEALRPLSGYRFIGLSVAHELEIVGVIRLLEGAGIPVLAATRGPRDPIVIGGGPLTMCDPGPLLPFVDLLMVGEADEQLPRALEAALSSPTRAHALTAAAALASMVVGEIEPGLLSTLPPPARAADESLPAHSAVTTPDSELPDMFLVEAERGCSRSCRYCIMSAVAARGGMRVIDVDRILSVIPPNARRVGLVGAAVTDHPRIEALVARIVDDGREIGISSLRAERLTPALVAHLRRGGHRTLTVASDGTSERLRRALDRRVTEQDLVRAAELARDHGLLRMKLYEMIGVPGETDDDIEELAGFALELAKIVRLTLACTTFVAKRNTALAGEAFVGRAAAEDRLRRLRSRLRGRVEVRPQSPRWSHVEYELARRGPTAGHAVLAAVHAGGRYRDFVRAFARTEPRR
jgi:radical SAM superfamily enzyme YgiQ (UPF0313 family)